MPLSERAHKCANVSGGTPARRPMRRRRLALGAPEYMVGVATCYTALQRVALPCTAQSDRRESEAEPMRGITHRENRSIVGNSVIPASVSQVYARVGACGGYSCACDRRADGIQRACGVCACPIVPSCAHHNTCKVRWTRRSRQRQLSRFHRASSTYPP